MPAKFAETSTEDEVRYSLHRYRIEREILEGKIAQTLERLNAIKAAAYRATLPPEPPVRCTFKLYSKLVELQCAINGKRAVEFDYINHRGEKAVRRVRPIKVWYGTTAWHQTEGFLLHAYDLDRGESRDFCVEDITFDA